MGAAGIVDILQEWTWRKRVERVCKVRLLQQDPDGISCMHPYPYAVRFLSRVVDALFEGAAPTVGDLPLPAASDWEWAEDAPTVVHTVPAALPTFHPSRPDRSPTVSVHSSRESAPRASLELGRLSRAGVGPPRSASMSAPRAHDDERAVQTRRPLHATANSSL